MGLKWVCVLVLGAASAVAQDGLGSITGTVVDVVGSQVPDATVTIVGAASREAKSNSWGEFVIAGLAPGTYKLRIQEAGFIPKDLDVAVEAGKETTLGPVALEVRSPPPCVGNMRRPRVSETELPTHGKSRVSGSTRGEIDGALSNMTITLLAAGTSKAIATTSTNRNGEFRFEDVKPGTFDVAVTSGAGTFLGESTFANVRRVRVRKRHELEVHLTWEQPPGQICL